MAQKYGYMSKQFLGWFLANVLGFGAVGALILVLPSVMTFSGFFVATSIIAIPIGLAQWIALSRISKTSVLWILTVPIGTPLGFYLTRLIPDGLWFDAGDDSLVAMTSMLLVVGLIIGLLQWIILRRQLVRASLWLLGSAIGVAGSFWLIMVTDLIHQSGVVSYAVVALVYSGMTGLVLSGLLAYNNQSQPRLANAT